ncbi:MAG: sugar phosphate isomerase/epimerase family protein [Desulfobulbus sp.]
MMRTTASAQLPQWGLKLWSTNTGYYLPAARALYAEKLFDYIELYIVPGDTASLGAWQGLDIPFLIHCAHSSHGFNLSLAQAAPLNRRLFQEAVRYYAALHAAGIIIHPGVEGEIEETIRQINSLIQTTGIPPSTLFLENKPAITLTNERATASSSAEMFRIREATGTGFVLDIAHAVKFALSKKLDIWTVLDDFMQYKPEIIHICDARMTTPYDEHLHIGDGELVFEKIFERCWAERISVETMKDSKYNLNDFVQDITALKKYYESTVR